MLEMKRGGIGTCTECGLPYDDGIHADPPTQTGSHHYRNMMFQPDQPPEAIWCGRREPHAAHAFHVAQAAARHADADWCAGVFQPDQPPPETGERWAQEGHCVVSTVRQEAFCFEDELAAEHAARVLNDLESRLTAALERAEQWKKLAELNEGNTRAQQARADDYLERMGTLTERAEKAERERNDLAARERGHINVRLSQEVRIRDLEAGLREIDEEAETDSEKRGDNMVWASLALIREHARDLLEGKSHE